MYYYLPNVLLDSIFWYFISDLAARFVSETGLYCFLLIVSMSAFGVRIFLILQNERRLPLFFF